MFTQCPSCKTLFRVTEEQLSAFGGKVRCGFCYGTFNALSSLYDDLPSKEAVNEANRVVHQQSHPSAITDEEPNSSGIFANSQRLPPDLAREYEAEGVSVRAPTHATLDREQDVSPPARPANKPAKPAPAATAEPGAKRKPRSAKPSKPHPSTSSTAELPDLMDVINVAGKDFQHATRLELDTRRQNKRSGNSELAITAAWAFATLLLVFLIVAQYIYFKRNDLANHAQLRPVLEAMCEFTGCTIPLQKNPKLISLVSRDIRTHPSVEDALQVRATFLNEADFVQPYPLLRLDLTDINGNVVASRNFKPNEYLEEPADLNAGIAPNQQIDIKLDIIDPDENAVGFEFSFL